MYISHVKKFLQLVGKYMDILCARGGGGGRVVVREGLTLGLYFGKEDKISIVLDVLSRNSVIFQTDIFRCSR